MDIKYAQVSEICPNLTAQMALPIVEADGLVNMPIINNENEEYEYAVHNATMESFYLPTTLADSRAIPPTDDLNSSVSTSYRIRLSGTVNGSVVTVGPSEIRWWGCMMQRLSRSPTITALDTDHALTQDYHFIRFIKALVYDINRHLVTLYTLWYNACNAAQKLILNGMGCDLTSATTILGVVPALGFDIKRRLFYIVVQNNLWTYGNGANTCVMYWSEALMALLPNLLRSNTKGVYGGSLYLYSLLIQSNGLDYQFDNSNNLLNGQIIRPAGGKGDTTQNNFCTIIYQDRPSLSCLNNFIEAFTISTDFKINSIVSPNIAENCYQTYRSVYTIQQKRSLRGFNANAIILHPNDDYRGDCRKIIYEPSTFMWHNIPRGIPIKNLTSHFRYIDKGHNTRAVLNTRNDRLHITYIFRKKRGTNNQMAKIDDEQDVLFKI